MSYKSDAQRRFFNSEAGKKKIGEKEVEHWNKESKGLKLPEKVGDAIGATPKEEFDRLSNYIDNLVKEKAHPKYIKREVSSIKRGIPSKISSNVLTKELGSELSKKINQILRQIEVKDTEPEYDPITKTMRVKTLGTKDAIYDNVIKIEREKAKKIIDKYEKAIRNAKSFDELEKLYNSLSRMDGEIGRQAQEFVDLYNNFSNDMGYERELYLREIKELISDAFSRLLKMKGK